MFGILYTVYGMTIVAILHCEFRLHLLLFFAIHCMYEDVKGRFIYMDIQKMNLDSCVVNFPRTHTTHAMNIVLIYIGDYVDHHRGGLFFLLQLICVPLYTYK